MAEPIKKLKISDPIRVENIIQKFCSAQIQCLVRLKDEQSVGIRANFGARTAGEDNPYIELANVSAIGLHRLKEGSVIIVEVIGSSALVVFMSQIRRRSEGTLAIDIPGMLMNVERRANLRCKTNTQNIAFAQLTCWQPAEDDVATPPGLPPFEKLRSLLSIADFSVGGLCVSTRFPSVYNFLENGMIDNQVRIWLPRSSPVVISMQVRWKKIVREKVSLPEGDASMMNNVRTLSDFRIGYQFVNPEEEKLIKIRQFMRRLMHADAI